MGYSMETIGALTADATFITNSPAKVMQEIPYRTSDVRFNTCQFPLVDAAYWLMQRRISAARKRWHLPTDASIPAPGKCDLRRDIVRMQLSVTISTQLGRPFDGLVLLCYKTTFLS